MSGRGRLGLVIWVIVAVAAVLLWVLLAIDLMVDGGGASRRRSPKLDLRLPAESLSMRSQAAGSESDSAVHHLIDRTLACIREIESDHRYHAISPDSRYFGAYQFDSRTWGSVGGRGNPSVAAPAEQDYRAALVLLRRGLQPWPSADRCAA